MRAPRTTAISLGHSLVVAMGTTAPSAERQSFGTLLWGWCFNKWKPHPAPSASTWGASSTGMNHIQCAKCQYFGGGMSTSSEESCPPTTGINKPDLQAARSTSMRTMSMYTPCVHWRGPPGQPSASLGGGRIYVNKQTGATTIKRWPSSGPAQAMHLAARCVVPCICRCSGQRSGMHHTEQLHICPTPEALPGDLPGPQPSPRGYESMHTPPT
jgi:hypothetical protein